MNNIKPENHTEIQCERCLEYDYIEDMRDGLCAMCQDEDFLDEL